MKNYFFLLFFSLISSLSSAQLWSWQELAPMPEAVSNNAVTMATVNNTPYVYSFSGIDTSKIYAGIHLKSFRYNVNTNTWETIAPLPDTLGGKIAAGASTVNGKIYIIGGYHVASDGHEVSSKKIHIYDPETNTYLEDGADIPVAIDDHVQAVYKDSLIYVVTGWSNTTNVRNVQIYDTYNNTWLEGTQTPNLTDYKVFGASGTIIGDTIYYMGGAKFSSNFSPSQFLKKGYINPNDPTDITWSLHPIPNTFGYRMAATDYFDNVLWIGGSNVTYNYDGIAYNGSGGVTPLDRVMTYNPALDNLNTSTGLIPKIMDLRGIAKINATQFIIAGGMVENQKVTNKTFLLSAFANSINTIYHPEVNVYPTPTQNIFYFEGEGNYTLRLFNTTGQLLIEKKIINNTDFRLETLPKGVYYLEINNEKGRSSKKVIKQ